MKLLNHYIFRSVLGAILVVLLVICSLDLLGQLVDELRDLSERYTFLEASIYVSLAAPIAIYKYMPFAVLVGSLIGLGSLAATSELVVMRAAGVSLWRITWAVMKPVLLLIVISLLLAEYVNPVAEQYAKNRRALIQDKANSALSSRSGVWNREGTEFMHFNRVEANGRLLGVTRFRFDEFNQLQFSSFAQSAIYSDGRWQEENVIESRFTAEGVIEQAYSLRPWNIELSPTLLSILVQETNNLSISKLYHYILYLQQQNIVSGRYQLSFWNKALQPLATMSLVLIAISFIFGPLREVTMGYRIFSGVVVGIVFQLSQQLLGPTSIVYGFPPVIAVLIPILICFFIGFFLLNKNR